MVAPKVLDSGWNPAASGRIVGRGTRDQAFDDPQHQCTHTLLGAVPTIPTEWDARRRGLPDSQAAEAEAIA